MGARAVQPRFLFPDGARFGADNVILHARARRHTVQAFAGPLSIKSTVSGCVSWTVNGSDLLVDPNSFLVLGEGEEYSMDIDAPRIVETACAFFRQGFVEQTALDATTAIEASLDDPARTGPSVPARERVYLRARASSQTGALLPALTHAREYERLIRAFSSHGSRREMLTSVS